VVWRLEHPRVVGRDSIPDKRTGRECLIDLIGVSAEIIHDVNLYGILALFLAYGMFNLLLSGWYALLSIPFTGIFWLISYGIAEKMRPYRGRHKTAARCWRLTIERTLDERLGIDVDFGPEQGIVENLCLTSVGNNLYRIEEKPFPVDCASFGDVIEADRQSDGLLRFRRVVEKPS
jgi:hypothetical protein